ncbi:MAG TPA: head GIN domain-containing protein [Vicinamibacterales bacterium]|nr:head GIN domain-containing protein [Vicinamibacterales bacterium]
MLGRRACLLLSCSVLLGACQFNSISGSGKIATEPRTVSGFSAVSLSGSGRLIIEQTGAESLTVTTDDNLLPLIRTQVNGNILELGSRDPMTNLRPTDDIVFTMTVRQLDRLDVSGSGKVDVKRLTASRLAIDISGSGEVAAQGASNDLNLSISGSGEYQGEQLRSQRARVEISGSGGALVAAAEALNVSVSGSGAVEYIGDPKVTQQVSGSGSVRRR